MFSALKGCFLGGLIVRHEAIHTWEWSWRSKLALWDDPVKAIAFHLSPWRSNRRTGSKQMALPTFTMRQMLEAGVHFGHSTRRWNPKMEPYIFGERNKTFTFRSPVNSANAACGFEGVERCNITRWSSAFCRYEAGCGRKNC